VQRVPPLIHDRDGVFLRRLDRRSSSGTHRIDARFMHAELSTRMDTGRHILLHRRTGRSTAVAAGFPHRIATTSLSHGTLPASLRHPRDRRPARASSCDMDVASRELRFRNALEARQGTLLERYPARPPLPSPDMATTLLGTRDPRRGRFRRTRRLRAWKPRQARAGAGFEAMAVFIDSSPRSGKSSLQIHVHRIHSRMRHRHGGTRDARTALHAATCPVGRYACNACRRANPTQRIASIRE